RTLSTLVLVLNTSGDNTPYANSSSIQFLEERNYGQECWWALWLLHLSLDSRSCSPFDNSRTRRKTRRWTALQVLHLLESQGYPSGHFQGQKNKIGRASCRERE